MSFFTTLTIRGPGYGPRLTSPVPDTVRCEGTMREKDMVTMLDGESPVASGVSDTFITPKGSLCMKRLGYSTVPDLSVQIVTLMFLW